MAVEKPQKNLEFKPSSYQYCPFLKKNVEDARVEVLVIWLPYYSREQYGRGRYGGDFMESAVYRCSLSGASRCMDCLSSIYKEKLSKLGFELRSSLNKNR